MDEKNIIVAKTAGFCFGVSRAVDMVYRAVEESDGPVYTYGPIIHNETVVDDLAARGVGIINTPEELSALNAEHPDKIPTVIIRSHGISRAERAALESAGCRLTDATCPFVTKIHRIVEKASAEGHPVIIVGDPNHAEVKAIRGWSGENTWVVGGEEDTDHVPELTGAVIVSQTTFEVNKLIKIVEKLKKKCYDVSVMNTICNATQERQQEAREISEGVDAMLVIGGKHSSNAQKLYSICSAACPVTMYIQTVADLEGIDFPRVHSIGITAGASTPGTIIEEVHSYVRSEF